MSPSLRHCQKLKAGYVSHNNRHCKVGPDQRTDGYKLRYKKSCALHGRGKSFLDLNARYIDDDKGWCKSTEDSQGSEYFYRQTSNSNTGEVLSTSKSSGECQSLQKNGKGWHLEIFIVGTCMLLCNLDRVAMGILAVPLLKEFSISLTEMGVLQSSYLWGYLIGQLPAGLASDKYGGTKVMLGGLVLWSFATCGTALAKFSSVPLTVAIASRVLMGLGSSVALPAVASTVAREVPAESKARSTTISYALFNIGNVLGNLCTPYVSEYVGWHWSFMLYGAVGLVWAVVASYLLKLSKSNRNVASQPQVQVQVQVEKNKKTPRVNILKVMFKKKFLVQLFILMYCHSTIGLGYFTLQSWIPTFMANDLGITSLKVAGLCTALVWLATSFNTAFVGVIADKLLKKMPTWKVRRAAMTISTVVPSLCFLILSTTRNPLVGICCILVGLVCWSFDYAGFHPYIVEVSGKYSGTILSLTNSAGVIAGIVGNITTGYLVGLEGNFNAVFRILSGVYLLSCVLWNLFMKGEKLDFKAA